jgi:hypothetical protein
MNGWVAACQRSSVMNDEEFDYLVAQSMYSNTDVRSLDLRVGEADLMENVMNSTTPTIERPQPTQPTPPRRQRWWGGGVAVAQTDSASLPVTRQQAGPLDCPCRRDASNRLLGRG